MGVTVRVFTNVLMTALLSLYTLLFPEGSRYVLSTRNICKTSLHYIGHPSESRELRRELRDPSKGSLSPLLSEVAAPSSRPKPSKVFVLD